MWYDPDQKHHLSSLLHGVLDHYEIEYLTYWDLVSDPEDPQFTLYQLGLALGRCIHSLVAEPDALDSLCTFLAASGVPGNLDLEQAVREVKKLAGQPVVRDSIVIQLGHEARDELFYRAEDRAQFLLSLLGTRTLSERAAMFLDRATRLYVWGFNPECVIMCASVLEAALESRFLPEDMFRLQITKERGAHTFHQYIQAAYADRVFTADERDRANALRVARNDVLHNVPGAVADSREALETLVVLLGAVFPPDERH